MLKIVLSLQIITTYMWKATPRGSLSGALNIRDIREGDLWLRTKLLDHAIPRIRCGTHLILGINFQQAFKTLSWHHLHLDSPPPLRNRLLECQHFLYTTGHDVHPSCNSRSVNRTPHTTSLIFKSFLLEVADSLPPLSKYVLRESSSGHAFI